MSETKHICKHCGGELQPWESPLESTWGGRTLYVCFNDECEYYTRGWKWMYERFQQNASYRYMLDPEHGREYPLPVWSATAHRNKIVTDD